MAKLLITDITIMGPAFCVIGLEHTERSFHSIRPLPPRGNGWAHFPHGRGDVLSFLLSAWPAARPHTEDRPSTGILAREATVAETELVSYLRKAEISENLSGLFQCAVHENRHGTGIYVEPDAAARSICGCEIQNIRFQLFQDANRATISLCSGESLAGLPLVDRDWNAFIELAMRRMQGANRLLRVNRFLNKVLAEKVLNDSLRFARIGLTRLHNEKHWLMLDSLFPLPQKAWLDDLPV